MRPLVPDPLHSWELTPKEAISLQKTLAGRVDTSRPIERFDLVAGADCSYNRFSPWFYAVVVVWRRRDGAIVDRGEAIGKSPFPYVPGLLSFRELPIVLKAYESLTVAPDVILFDGQGIAHPRRIGIASHLGLWLDVPTIGCAKSRLIGEHREPGMKRDSTARLIDDGDVIGDVVRTKNGCKPLYISPGHRIDRATSVRAVLACCRGYRLPEPTRLAHQTVNDLRRRHREE
jgi:deoxyribonuclease V